MTVSSYNTVTLTPQPVISFNVKTPSETYNAICSSGRFAVHLLAATHASARVARRFAGGNAHLLLDDGNGSGDQGSGLEKGQGRGSGQGPGFRFVGLDGGPVRTAIAEPPRVVIEQSADADAADAADAADNAASTSSSSQVSSPFSTPHIPFILDCEALPQSLRVSTHVIMLGRVISVRRPDAAKDGERDSTGSALSWQIDDAPHEPRELCLTYADTRFWGMGRGDFGKD